MTIAGSRVWALRRRRAVLLATLLVLLAAASSDTILFAVPGALTHSFEQGIARRYRRDGMVARWALDDLAAADAVGGARSVTFGTRLTAGRFGSARAFPGRNDSYISTPVRWQALGERYTISAWLKLNPASRDQAIVFTEAAGTSGLMLSAGRMVLAVPHRARRLASYPFEGYGRFVNVTGVVDAQAGHAALYEDGVLRARVEIEGVTHVGDFIEFGKARPYHVYYPLDGTLDEVVVWDRALSPSEVAAAAGSGSAVEARLALGHTLGYRAMRLAAAGLGAALKAVDHFNPRYHWARLTRSRLPVFELVLSGDDLRALGRWRAERAASDDAGPPIRRRVGVGLEQGRYEADLVPYGEDPALRRHPNPSFRLDAEPLAAVLGARSWLFAPPETEGLVRGLVSQRLAERYGLPRDHGRLALVRINGRPATLYRIQPYPPESAPPPHPDGGLPGDLGRLPVPESELLAAYDAARAEVEPLLLNDKTTPLSMREIRYRLRRDRDRFERWAARSRALSEADQVAMVAEHLSEALVLNGNPAASHVIGDLNLNVMRLPALRLVWASSDPGVIAPDGRVRQPPGGGPRPVTLEASVVQGRTALRKALHFVVMPSTTTLPLLRLHIPGQLRNTHRTACRAEFIEDAGTRRSGALACAIKLRGNTTLHAPKKSFSLRLETRFPVPEFSGSRIVHLISAYSDPSLMKNKLAYDLFRSFGESDRPRYSPHVHLIELFLNDRYHGIYQLSERVDRFMLGIARSRRGGNTPGVIYKAQHDDASFHAFAPHAYFQIEPDADDGEHWGPLEALIRFIGTADSETFRRDIESWVDVDAFIDYHVLVNLFANREAVRFNLFLIRDAAPDSRFTVVPWDYDKSLWGEDDAWLTNHLFDRLSREVPGIAARYKQRWRALRTRQLREDAILARIADLERTLAPSVAREFDLWPRPRSTYAANVEHMKTWIPRRLRAMDRQIEAM